jgi:hypothetical protein
MSSYRWTNTGCQPSRCKAGINNPFVVGSSNLEVNVEHVYHVGETGLLVHNSYIAKAIDNLGDDALDENELIKHWDPRTNEMGTATQAELHGDHVLSKIAGAGSRKKKETRALFKGIVLALNEIQDETQLILTEERDAICDALEIMGNIVELDSISEDLDRWRNW